MRKLFIALIIVLFTINTATATTLLEIKTKVRNYLHESDTTNTNYNDTMCVEAVNTSIEFLINTLPTSCHYNLLELKLQACTPNVGEYALPTDFKFIVSTKFYADNTPMIQLSPMNFATARNKATAKDPAFMIYGSKIYIFPYPTLNQQFDYMYMKQPAKMVSDSDTIPLLPIYDEPIVLGAVVHILNMDNQSVRAATIEKYLANQLTGITNAMLSKNAVQIK